MLSPTRPAQRKPPRGLDVSVSSDVFTSTMASPSRMSPTRLAAVPPPTESPGRDGRRMRLIMSKQPPAGSSPYPEDASGSSALRLVESPSGGARRRSVAGSGSVGVLAIRGEGSRVAFFAAGGAQRCRDVEGLLAWASPEHGEEELQSDAAGCIMVVVSGGGVSVALKVERAARAGAMAVVILSEVNAPPSLPEADTLSIPVVGVRASDRSALISGAHARLLFPSRAEPLPLAPSLSLAELLEGEGGGVVGMEALGEIVRVAAGEECSASKVAEAARKVQEIAKENVTRALAALHRALREAEERCEVATGGYQERAVAAEGRARFLEGMVEDLSKGVERSLRLALAEEQRRVAELEEQLHIPEVQILLRSRKPKGDRNAANKALRSGGAGGLGTSFPAAGGWGGDTGGKRRVTLHETFDATNRAGGAVYSINKASEILGKTKPGDLSAAADLLAGQAAENVGSEDAEVLRLKSHLRVKEGNKFFSRWYNLVQWRTLAKVVRDNVIPLPHILPNKSGVYSGAHTTMHPSSPGLPQTSHGKPSLSMEHSQSWSNRMLPSVHGAGGASAGEGGGARAVGTGGDSVAGAIARSFVVELQSVEKENKELREMVRVDVKKLYAAKEDLREQHNRFHVERLGWGSKLVELEGLVSILVSEVESVTGEMRGGRTLEELRASLLERDELQHERDGLAKERDSLLSSQRTAVFQLAHCEANLAQLSASVGSLDGVMVDVDQAQAEKASDPKPLVRRRTAPADRGLTKSFRTEAIP